MDRDHATPGVTGGSTPVASGAKSWRRRILSIPTSVIFAASLALALALLWRQGTLGDLGDTVRNAEPRVIVVATGLYLASVVVLCLRWQALVRMAGGRNDPPRAAEALLTSVVVNYAAPKGLAVPTRAMLSARDLGLSATASGAVALWDVTLDILALGLMSLAWFLMTDFSLLSQIGRPNAGIAVVALGFIVVGVVGVAIVARRRPDLRERAQAAAREMVAYPGRRPIAALAALALTAGYWLLQIAVFGLMLDAVGMSIAGNWEVVLGLLGPPVLIGMFSPTPGGSGVREALMVAVAQARGLPGAPVLLAAVAYRVALLIAVPVLYVVVRAWRGWRERMSLARSNAGHE